jgi:tetratricopeptide (TPR) repeat protein
MQSIVSSRSLFIRFLLSDEVIKGATVRQLIELAEFAIAWRLWKKLAQIATQLAEVLRRDSNADIPLLYTGLALNRLEGYQAQGEQLLLRITESSLPALRARAYLALGSNAISEDKAKSIAFYQKAADIDKESPLNVFHVAMMSIAAEAGSGNRMRTLDALNSIATLAQYVGSIHRPYWLEYQNSVAVAFNDLGDYDSAEKALAPALASPFATAYREWGQTDDEIVEAKNRKPMVSVSGPLRVLDFPSVNRIKQVQRIEAVLLDTAHVNAERLRLYANAGEAALCAPPR